MKNVLSRFAVFVSFLAVFLFAGCSNGLEVKNDSDFSAKYGTLVINQKSERAVQSEQIVTADVCVVGSDMEILIRKLKEFVFLLLLILNLVKII